MARHLPEQNFQLLSDLCIGSRRSCTNKPTGVSFFPFKSAARKVNTKIKWGVKSSVVEQTPQQTTVDVKQLVDFLYDDLPHLFDDQGIDRNMYDEQVKFRDPITKHDTISGYLLNINLLKKLFQPDFQLHYVKQTGPYEITTRWTMVMKFILLPWKPELVFTGLSIMGINPQTQKFCSHADLWDSIQNNEYFSLEGLLDVVKQLRIYKTPDLESPEYQILKRTASYEVRKYLPFVVVETQGDKLSGSKGFNDVAGYIFGKNSTAEKIPMTTPVFTQAFDDDQSKISIQIVLPREKDLNGLPDPNQETLGLKTVEGGIAAVLKFSGKPEEDVVREKEKALRSALIRDGLKPKAGCMFARYNDPGRTWNFVMRNEVIIWLEDFKLE
ncbi:Soul heme-binding family protein [Thalictrum thalictroides]|uniref:Soul heme-binding family protein n=1 Tax=Thalictrum thalictroides TaxID=46969 RepID=A0A7J6V1U8_THATH|nr:Soul heme-binding family protein [Thalictrum thalictroides]